MPQRAPERIVYDAVRDMPWMRTAPSATSQSGWSIQFDRRAWDARGRNFKLYLADRPEPCAPKPSVHTELIHVDAGSKMSVSHRVYRSPIRYAAMRRESGGRSEPVVPSGTDEVVGPGKYDPIIPTEVGRKPAFSIDGTSSFASRELRVPPSSFQLPHRTAEPGYSNIALDRSAWNRKGSGHPKGEAWAKSQRFRRPPGPGSNLPENKPPPGPGSYQKLHSWPSAGYTGTAKGFNHKGR